MYEQNLTYTPEISAALFIFTAPLFMFFFLMFFGRIVNKYRGIMATTVMFATFLTSIWLFKNVWNAEPEHWNMQWFWLGGDLSVNLGVHIDNISVFMILLVSFISFLVHLFSIEYLRGDKNFEKYFAYLGLFTAAMMGIVMSDNLFLIFMFWELVGVSSYLLIGFWFTKPEAIQASKKAFIVNRIGDAGFIIGLMVFWSIYKTFDLTTLYKLVSETIYFDQIGNDGIEAGVAIFQSDRWMLIVGGLGLLMGCMGKSAQFPLQVWLPDAMEGPTPVSALIHAATMVAAGVYLLSRIFIILPVEILDVAAFIGAVTAIMGGVAAVAQYDIKKVLAFSTISQLGYMVAAMGVGSYSSALFHLLTHAFFKACLFLSAGAVIYQMHKLEHKIHADNPDFHFDAQDMRSMGGLRKYMPITFLCYLVASAALAGIPFFSGFLSKDAILFGMTDWAQGKGGGIYWIVPVLGFSTAILTAFYMTRQVILVFFHDFRLKKSLEKADKLMNSLGATPFLMKTPIIILACLSFWFVFTKNPFQAEQGWFTSVIQTPARLNPEILSAIPPESHIVSHSGVALISIFLVAAGIFAGIFLYRKPQTELNGGGILFNISYNNWYLNRIYSSTLVAGTLKLGRLLSFIDESVLDRLINLFAKFQVVLASLINWFDRWVVDGLINAVLILLKGTGQFFRSMQGGKIQNYIIIALLMIGAIIWVLVKISS